MNLLNYIRNLKAPTLEEIKKKELSFGEITRQKTLIFDLDETLIHSLPLSQSTQDRDFEITMGNGQKFAVCIRPYVPKCLEHLS